MRMNVWTGKTAPVSSAALMIVAPELGVRTECMSMSPKSTPTPEYSSQPPLASSILSTGLDICIFKDAGQVGEGLSSSNIHKSSVNSPSAKSGSINL